MNASARRFPEFIISVGYRFASNHCESAARILKLAEADYLFDSINHIDTLRRFCRAVLRCRLTF